MDKKSFYDEISANKRNSVILLMLVFGSLLFLGWFIGWFVDPSLASLGLIIAAVIAIISSWTGYYYSDKIVLATMKVTEAKSTNYRRLNDLVEGLAIGAGLPKPRLYVINSPDINAFATGRDPEHALIGITMGALELLDRDELEGVLAHELSHIKNYDILFMTLVATVVGMTVIISELFRRSLWYGGSGNKRDKSGLLIIIGLLFTILAPIIMKLVQLAISRKREFLADASGAQISRNPEGLADALEKIVVHNKNRLQASKAVHHLFIANPLKSVNSLFSTHPPVNERIKRLRAM
ncbi:MAG: M48 family metallopeptidase [Candidatus Nanoarchaeia archaeon]|jgi:heat shock protein HtpX